MIEVLKNSAVQAVALFLGCLLVIFVPGLWLVTKTTGRPLRDMLAVLGGAITFILLGVAPIGQFA